MLGKRHLTVAAHHEICKVTKGLFRVDCKQGSGMFRVELIERSPGLNSLDFAEDDSVWTEPQFVFRQIVEGNVGLECIR